MMEIDCSIMKIHYEGNKFEWIYRGSKRLAPMYKSTIDSDSTQGFLGKRNPQIEYVAIDDSASCSPVETPRAVAKKSTATKPSPPLQENVPKPLVPPTVNQQGKSAAPFKPVKILNDGIIYIEDAPRVGKVRTIPLIVT